MKRWLSVCLTRQGSNSRPIAGEQKCDQPIGSLRVCFRPMGGLCVAGGHLPADGNAATAAIASYSPHSLQVLDVPPR